MVQYRYIQVYKLILQSRVSILDSPWHERVMLLPALVTAATLAFTPPGRGLSVTAARRVGSISLITADDSFRRGKLLDMWSSCSARDVVNVLGRWKSYKQWDSIGTLRDIDSLFDKSDWQPLKPLPVQFPSFFYTRRVGDSPLSSAEYAKQVREFEERGIDFKNEAKSYAVGERNDPRMTPQRRGWAKRNAQVQRYWHGENVGLLPFTDKRLAESIGCTVAEMQALPINPRAADIVFDALSRSQSGITEEETCDERRAAWQTDDGSFDADAFESDLWTARLTVAKAYFLFPGLPFIISNLVFYSPKVNGLQLMKDYAAKNSEMLAKNAALWSDAFSR